MTAKSGETWGKCYKRKGLLDDVSVLRWRGSFKVESIIERTLSKGIGEGTGDGENFGDITKYLNIWTHSRGFLGV